MNLRFQKKKKIEETLCLQPRRCVSISLHLHLCKLPFIWWILPFISQMIAFLGSLVILTIKILYALLQVLFQRLNAGKLWEMLKLIKATQHALRTHNLILLISFLLSLSPKQWRCFTNFNLQILGDIWLTEKFAFANDTFLQARFRNDYQHNYSTQTLSSNSWHVAGISQVNKAYNEMVLKWSR